jgi:predicted glycoside hydrolase/deacetylase ChbG (UPF0249 family)
MTNPVLEKTGFAPGTRLVIVHADDVGMCHAANLAFWETQAFGLVTCGAVMMPCPWVPEMAAWCRAHPEADVGVHLTLNSELRGYRWGPLSTRDPKSGLIDDDGYMWRSVDELHRHMDPDAAIAEMRAQIDAALAMGIDVTHVDVHMRELLMHPLLFSAYVQLATEYLIPAMLPRIPLERAAEWGLDPAMVGVLLAQLDGLVATGFPVLDMILAAREQGDHLAVYQRLFDQVPPGITHLLLHPSVPGHDVEAIVDSAPYRVADYQTFLRPELKDYVTGQGIQLVGYRLLRDLIRGEL